MTKFRITQMEPLARHSVPAFVTREDGCRLETITVGDYPPSPRGDELRRARTQDGPFTSIGELARAAGLGPAAISDLERGRTTMPDDDWASLMGVLRAVKAGR